MFSRRKKVVDPVNTAELARVGHAVQARLGADPSAYRLPVDGLDIYAIGQFFTPAERERLIVTVDEVARPSPTYYGGSGDSGRTSFTGDVDPWDPFILMLERRIDDLLGIDPDFGETIQGQRYTPGQQFQEHYDHFNIKHKYWQDEQKRGGQRSWTAMAYLNDVEEGGSTDFPRVNLSVPPQAGALLVWNNMTPEGLPNDKALHAGRPVVRGVKYVLTKWYRARKWH
ncbi:prolyl hydroxylase family protein [Novosphingobium lentum]|uniref:prolyl hydroxylase family protein n=1 Tax=Novosphingobium lentum TaxID=145287 RepID=UPI0008301AEC|nr:2OG-Fe(II) oxygenase [Novosphingobium lentum]